MQQSLYSSFSCDNWNFNASNPCVYAGGNYNQNDNYGLFYFNYNEATNKNTNIGGRILLDSWLLFLCIPRLMPGNIGTGDRAPLGED